MLLGRLAAIFMNDVCSYLNLDEESDNELSQGGSDEQFISKTTFNAFKATLLQDRRTGLVHVPWRQPSMTGYVYMYYNKY